MAYVGTPIDTTNQFQSLQGKRFDGDGSTTDFTLDVAPSSTLDIEVFVENVRQDPNSAYTLSGTTLSFTGAPPSGTNNIYVVHQAKAVGTIDPPATESVAKTFTSGVTSSTTDNSDNLTLTSTDDDANSGPNLRLYRNSSSPGDSDVLGQIDFEGRNDNSQDIVSARIQSLTQDVSDGTEDGKITINTIMDGTERVRINCHSGGITFRNADEEMRIDASGNVLVGKTSANDTDVGIALYNTGKASFVVAGDSTKFNRTSDNGQIAVFQKDGTTIGSINVGDSDLIIGKTDGGVQCYLRFAYSTDKIIPSTDAGGTNDNLIDLGDSGSRFDDIHATNGTIQTSDETEKQSIQSLTSTEIAVAKRLSKLFKTFKFNSSVEKKGDSARTHTGIIAQNVKQAFADEGLDASNYGMFISSTWWESEEGAITKEETEGYTKKTRLGIRYPELLSFVSSAFEQRLTDIETRVTALEG